jgi:hypothetical protein
MKYKYLIILFLFILFPIYSQGQVTFEWSPNPAYIYGRVHFKSVGVPANYAYTWDFGDGSEASLEDEPSHIYSKSGSYEVTMTCKSMFYGGIDYAPVKKTIEIKTAPQHEACFITDLSVPIIPIGKKVYFYNCSEPRNEITGWAYRFETCNKQDPDIYGSGYKNAVEYTFLNKGHLCVRLNIDFQNTFGKEIDKWFDIVNCDETVTNDFSIATLDDWNNVYRYWTGNFNLQNLNDISDYNSKMIELSACNEITLNPGFEVEPTGSNYLLLRADEPNLQGGNIAASTIKTANEHITDLAKPKVMQMQEIRIYPNPSKGKINIEFPDIEQIDYYEIYNTLGQKIYFENDIQLVEIIDLTSGLDGMYVINIVKVNNNNEMHKVFLTK